MKQPRLQPPPVRIAVEDAAVVRERARGRIRIVGGLLAVAMAFIAGRGVLLAVDPDPRTLAIATDKRWSSVTTQGERGMITDADGHVLAKSVKHPAVFVDPQTAQEQARDGGMPIDVLAARLAGLLELPEADVEDVLRGKGRYTRLAKGVHPEIADRIRDMGLDRRGVIIEENYRRFYPQGSFAAQLLGFVDDAGTGKQGLERYFNDELKGTEIVSQHRVNRWGRVLELFHRDDRSVEGQTVHTTIDRVVQRAAEEALAQTLADHAPISATAVVVEVATGRILAMATAPTFNPNDISELAEDDYKRTQNLSVTSAIEPGSVLKPFTLATALEAGVVTPQTVLYTPSPYVVAGARIKDDHEHPRVTSLEMVKYSSNIAAAQIAGRLGPDRMLSGLQAFGFGERSGIDTQGELSGTRRPRSHFGPVELATISYGQGLSATALQLAMATAAIANGGVRMEPLLVDRITDPYGRQVRAWEPTVAARVVSAATAQQVTRAMEMVTEDGGTGTRARVPGYLVAAKTGTAQKPKGGTYSAARYATFIGFAPADAPEVAIAIIVDEPTVGSRYGGVVAAPAFQAILQETLQHRGVPPDPALLQAAAVAELDAGEPDPPREPVAVAWTGEAWTMPDLAGRPMRDALAGLQGTGVRLQVEGSGLLAEQLPAAGRAVRPGDVVQLRFQ